MTKDGDCTKMEEVSYIAWLTLPPLSKKKAEFINYTQPAKTAE